MNSKIKISNLFVDMDDVLAGFYDGFFAATGKDIRDLDSVEGWRLIGEHSAKGLFYNLKPTAGYDAVRALMVEARSAGATVGCLTNVGNPRNYDVIPVALDKTRWLQTYGLGDFPMFWTVTGTGKAAFAHKNAMLIDDNLNNCSHFKNQGGYAIIYDDAVWQSVIKEIKENYVFGRN